MLSHSVCQMCQGDARIINREGYWLCPIAGHVNKDMPPPAGCACLFAQSIAAGMQSVNIDTEVAPDGGKVP
jgi:hypothetical protein